MGAFRCLLADADERFARHIKISEAMTGPEARLLIALLSGERTGSCLAKELAIDQASVSRMLNGLLDTSLVERSRTPRDRRVVFTRLTDKGKWHALRLRSTWRDTLDMVVQDARRHDPTATTRLAALISHAAH